ncbi:MAG: hypothetical protein RLZZ67_484 [Candidatus Parcubacteria bacterium]|jgi:hypothetical protein
MLSGKRWKILFFTLNTHGTMRIIQTVSKVLTSFGTLEIKVTQVKGLRLRKKVAVRR